MEVQIENKEGVYMNHDELKINGIDGAIKLNGDVEKANLEEGETSSTTMERKRVEFSENLNLSPVGKDSKIVNSTNGMPLDEEPMTNKGKLTEIKIPDGELNVKIDENDVQIDMETEIVSLENKRKNFRRGNTLPSIKKKFGNATSQASTMLRSIKAPKFKSADAAGRSNSLKLDFKNQQIAIVKNTNTIKMISPKEFKESLVKMKSSINGKPSLVRNKTMPSTNNRYLGPQKQSNGDDISLNSESILEGGVSPYGDKVFLSSGKRSAPPRPEQGPAESADMISPTFASNVNAENSSEFNTKFSDLNPTQFHHSSHYNSQTLEAYPKSNKKDIDDTKKINMYLDKIRAKITETSNRAKTPVERVILDRQEVYKISLKNKSLTRRHTTLNPTNSAIQSRIARPELKDTLRFAIDPQNAHTLDNRNKAFTLDRAMTLDNGFEKNKFVKLVMSTLKRDGNQQISARMQSMLNQTNTEIFGTTYFPVDHSYEIEMRGSPFYGEKLKKTLPKDLLKREAMETTNPFLEYNKNMKKTDEASKSNAKDSDVKHLEAYMNASMNLQEADLRPEFLTFFTGYSTINPRKWSNRGAIKDWPELNLFKNHENGLDYIKLVRPKNMELENTIAYPLVSVDAMMKNWLEKKTALPENLDEFKTPKNQDLLHTLSFMSTLDDLTACIDASEIIRINIGLAVMLSLDYCYKTYQKFNISADPTQILLVGAPTNCLVIFRLTQPRMTPLSSEDLVNNFSSAFDILHIEKKGTLEAMINDLVACGHISLHTEMQDQAEFSLKLLKCVSPPDWTAVCMARVGLHKLDKSD